MVEKDHPSPADETPAADEEGVELRAGPKPNVAMSRTWASRTRAYTNRGPLTFSAMALTLALTAALWLILFLGREVLLGSAAPSDGGRLVGDVVPGAATDDALVLLRFEGEAEVIVDDRVLGVFQDRVRLLLRSGLHRVVVQGQEGRFERSIDVRPGVELDLFVSEKAPE